MVDVRSIPSTGDALGVFTMAISYILLLLDTIVLGLRLWSRRLKRVPLCFNDYALLLAWPFTVGFVATATIGWRLSQHIALQDPKGLIVPAIDSGYVGQHEADIPRPEQLGQMPMLLRVYIAANLLWVFAITFIKLSILHLYLRVFRFQRFSWVVYGVGFLVVAFLIGVLLAQFLVCQPFAKNWDPMLPGTCGDSNANGLANAIADLCIDVVILALPMPILWNLQMPLRRKYMLSIIFGLGAIICVITILRAIASASLSESDFTYQVAITAIYAVLEVTLGIINACMPVIQPGLQKISELARGKSQQSQALTSDLRDLYSRTKNTTRGSTGLRSEDCFPLTEATLETHIRPESNPESFEERTATPFPQAAQKPEIRVRWDFEISHSARAELSQVTELSKTNQQPQPEPHAL